MEVLHNFIGAYLIISILIDFLMSFLMLETKQMFLHTFGLFFLI